MFKSWKSLAIFVALALALSLGVMAHASPGNHYYVDATNGDDTWGDGTQTRIDNTPAGWGPEDTGPWKTITYAVETGCPAGTSPADPNIIHVAAGTYDTSTNGETFPIDFDNNNVSLVGAGAGSTTVDGEDSIITTPTMFDINATGITIRDFTLEDADTAINADVGGFKILDNIFSNDTDHDIQYGVYVSIGESNLTDDYTFDAILIEDNEFYITSDGVYIDIDLEYDETEAGLSATIGDIDIFDNLFDMNTTDGVYIYIDVEEVYNGTISIGDVDISGGNEFTDGSYGVRFDGRLEDLNNTTVTVGDLMVNGNTFDDQTDYAVYIKYYDSAHTGFGSDNWRGTTTIDFGDIEVNGNDIDSDQASCLGVYIYRYGYWEYVEDDVAITAGGIYIEDNDPIDVDGTYAVRVYYYYTQEFTDNAAVTLGDLSIQRNVITAGAGISDDAICVEYDEVGYDFNGNTRFTGGDFYISDNEITDCGSDAIYVYFDNFGYESDNSPILTLGDVYIEDNEIGTNTTVGDEGIDVEYDYCAQYMEDDAIARIGNASICNNGIDAGYYGVFLEYDDVGYELYDSAQVFVGTVNISGNHAVGDDTAPMTTNNIGIYLYYNDFGAYTYDYSKATFGDVTMQNNGIDSGHEGIYLNYGTAGYYMYDSSDVTIGEVDISSNDIDSAHWVAAVHIYYDYVAYIMGTDSDPCDATLNMGDISISDNTIAGDSDGVYIDYYDDEVGYDMYDDAYAKLPSYVITGNIFNVTGDGIYLETYEIPYDIYDNSIFDFGGMLIDDNTFNGLARNAADPMDYGVYISLDDICYSSDNDSTTIIGDYTITNNEFYDLDSDAIYVYYDDIGYELYDDALLQVGDLEIADNLIDGAANGILVYYYSIYSYDDSTLTMGNLDITGNDLSNITTDGIYLYYNLDADDNSTQTIGRALVQDNILDPIGAADGIYVYMSKDSEAGATITLGEPVIDRNIIEEWVNGIYLEDVDGATITNNFIKDNDCGIHLDGSDNIDISNNDILKNPGSASGIHLDGDCGPDTVINYNNIVANSSGDWGIYNASTNVIDAENNWWGDPSGPDDDDGVINGTGDKISTDVDADPWLTQQSHLTIHEQTTTATASGTASIQTDGGAVTDLEVVAEGTLPNAGKPDLDFPHGFLSFNIMGLTPGQTVVVTITLPNNVPVGTEYWKYHASEGGWIEIPMGSDNGDNIITITLVDGGLGDDDLTADGVITDQGGPGFVAPPAPPVPPVPLVRPAPLVVPEVKEPTGVARFTMANLYVSPNEVPPNQPVGIQLDVTNVGQVYGYYDVVLLIDGKQEGGQRVYLHPRATQRVGFQVSRPTPGTYNVSVANQGGYFTVIETGYTVEVAPSQPSGGLGTPALIAIILGAVGVGIAIFFARRRKTY